MLTTIISKRSNLLNLQFISYSITTSCCVIKKIQLKKKRIKSCQRGRLHHAVSIISSGIKLCVEKKQTNQRWTSVIGKCWQMCLVVATEAGNRVQKVVFLPANKRFNFEQRPNIHPFKIMAASCYLNYFFLLGSNMLVA